MTLSNESKYPSRRTFVIKLRSDATPNALTGRLENIVSGQQLAFESAQELLESLAGALAISSEASLDASGSEP